MDENEFWTLIDRSREGHTDDVGAQEEALEEPLTGRPRGAVWEAYETTHGEVVTITGTARDAGPAGEEWHEDEVFQRYPRLAAVFG